MPLLGLAKDLHHESNGWGSHQGKARFLKQFSAKPYEKLFPWLNLPAWQPPERGADRLDNAAARVIVLLAVAPLPTRST